MKNKSFILLMIVVLSIASILGGCAQEGAGGGNNDVVNSPTPGIGGGNNEVTNSPSPVGDSEINVTFVSNGNGTGEVVTVTMYDNTSTDYILDRLPSANFPCDIDSDKTFAFHSSNTLRNCPENLEEVTTIKAGEIYLASGGQLRFYLDDVSNVSYSMTKLGFIEDMSNFSRAQAAAEAYASSDEMDFWGNDIYFRISLK